MLFEHFCREYSLEWGDFSRAVAVLVRFHREKAARKVLEVALERYPDSYHLAALKMKIQATPYAQSAQSQ